MVDYRSLITDRAPPWHKRLLRGGLRLASWPYGLGMQLRNKAYDWGWKRTYRPTLPVISVGNLSVGGTGKSPTVAWLARWFRQRDARVAILSRGYGQLDSGQNDEALELELQLPDVPHLQHWDRVASAQLAAEELDMQLLLLDDGFQHRRIARDLEIVLLDATDPPAARRLLPGGLLREPLRSLRRADIVLLTRVDQVAQAELEQLQRLVRRNAPRAEVVGSCHRPRALWSYPDTQQPIEELRGKRVLAFCAIGNPTSFFRGLSDMGAELLDRKTWPDHHGFEAADIATLEAWTERFTDAEMVVCTMKDWVKIQQAQIGRLRLSAVTVELEILNGREAFEAALARAWTLC